MLAYCTAMGLRQGHLIYAKGQGTPARHVVREVGVEVIAHALDLDVLPGALLGQLAALAKQVAETVPIRLANTLHDAQRA